MPKAGTVGRPRHVGSYYKSALLCSREPETGVTTGIRREKEHRYVCPEILRPIYPLAALQERQLPLQG